MVKRSFLAVSVAALALAAVAWAGELRYLGTIYTYGTSASNMTSVVALSDGGATNATFWIPFGAKLTLECDSDVRLLTDSATVSRNRDGGSTFGLPVAGKWLFQTSTGAPLATTDAGIPTALVSVISLAADAGAACDVWQRHGTE